MAEDIRKYDNNCVLVAIKEVTNKPDDDIMAAVRRHGYKDNKGMFQWQYHPALKELGVELERMDASRHGGFARTHGRRITLKDALSVLRQGVYLVQTRGHVFAVRDGRLIDRNYTRARLGRTVYSVIKVVNGYQPAKTGRLSIARHRTRRPGTRTWYAYEEAKRVIANGLCNSRAELLANCKIYDATDLAWDIRRGNIMEE